MTKDADGAPHASGVVTLRCDDRVDDVLRRVVDELQQRGIKLFTVVDHSGEARTAGLEMRDTKLVIVGNPKGGTPLMIAHPLIALDLPMKLLIWESNEGGAFLSYNTPQFLAERYELSPAETDVLRAVEAIATSVCSG